MTTKHLDPIKLFGDIETHKKRVLPLIKKYGWKAYHPQYIFHNEFGRYYKLIFTGHCEHKHDPDSPWHVYYKFLIECEEQGYFEPNNLASELYDKRSQPKKSIQKTPTRTKKTSVPELSLF